MSDEKITISVDELSQAKVDRRLKEQEAIARTRRYSQMDAGEVPSAAPQRRTGLLMHSPIVALTVFGLIGGLLAWGVVELLALRPDPAHRSPRIAHFRQAAQPGSRHRPNHQRPRPGRLKYLTQAGASNPFFTIPMDSSLTDAQKQSKLDQLNHDESLRDFITNFVGYGACGLIIAVFLSIAEPVVDKTPPPAS